MKPKLPEKERTRPEKEGLAAPFGMPDALPDEWPFRERIFSVARRVAEFYDFVRIETPILETMQVFRSGIGADNNMFEKELYGLATRAGETLGLRPEHTVGIARAYLQNRLGRAAPLQKLWYEGPVFREEKPEMGRLRQFDEIGLEIIGGSSDPLYDAQVILMLWKILEELKIKGAVLSVNSIGCRVCRPAYIRQLQAYYKNHSKDLCGDCERRLKTNPLRLLDCKESSCVLLKAETPNFFDKLCSTCSGFFTNVLEYLDEMSIPYMLDNFLVRGADYYSRTVFELSTEGIEGGLKTLAGGGRYDYLFELLDGKITPAVGGALGVEQVMAAMKAQGIQAPQKAEKRVFIMHVGESAKKKLLAVMEDLRAAGIQVSEALSRDSFQSQLKLANKDETKIALILGQKEVFEGSIIVRDLEHSIQETVPLSRMVEEVKKRLK